MALEGAGKLPLLFADLDAVIEPVSAGSLAMYQRRLRRPPREPSPGTQFRLRP